MAYDSTKPAGPNATTASVRDNFVALKALIDAGGGGGPAVAAFGTTEPASPVNGMLWFDTAASAFKIRMGTVWTVIG